MSLLENGRRMQNRSHQVGRDIWISHGDSDFLVGQQIASVGNDPRRVQLVLRDLLHGGSYGLTTTLRAPQTPQDCPSLSTSTRCTL